VLAGLLDYDGGELRRDDGRLQMLFQDAGASLTPWMTVGKLLEEPLGLTSPPVARSERRLRVAECLRSVGLPADVALVKSSTLSGGQRQRVAFARAVIVPPSLLLCDEPTSALDASLAAVVLNLLRSLRRQFRMSVVFVTHDLAVARIVADRIAVISEGKVVEIGPAERVIEEPQHSYTRQLIAAVPALSRAPAALDQMPGGTGSEQAGAG
jgi:peptide/nickel transport system ATP-binding protein